MKITGVHAFYTEKFTGFFEKNQQHASVGRIKLYLPKCDKIICLR